MLRNRPSHRHPLYSKAWTIAHTMAKFSVLLPKIVVIISVFTILLRSYTVFILSLYHPVKPVLINRFIGMPARSYLAGKRRQEYHETTVKEETKIILEAKRKNAILVSY